MDDDIKTALLSETAKIPWKELQYFFASGKVIYVTIKLDLIEVAQLIANDDKAAIESLLQENKICHISNDLAKKWYDNEEVVWAVVVKPWVLVQEINATG